MLRFGISARREPLARPNKLPAGSLWLANQTTPPLPKGAFGTFLGGWQTAYLWYGMLQDSRTSLIDPPRFTDYA